MLNTSLHNNHPQVRDIVHVGTPAEIIATGDTSSNDTVTPFPIRVLCMMDLLDNYDAEYIQLDTGELPLWMRIILHLDGLKRIPHFSA